MLRTRHRNFGAKLSSLMKLHVMCL